MVITFIKIQQGFQQQTNNGGDQETIHIGSIITQSIFLEKLVNNIKLHRLIDEVPHWGDKLLESFLKIMRFYWKPVKIIFQRKRYWFEQERIYFDRGSSVLCKSVCWEFLPQQRCHQHLQKIPLRPRNRSWGHKILAFLGRGYLLII